MIHPLYYRTGREDVLAARAEDMRGNDYVLGRGQAFADLFNGLACFTHGFTPHFAGITFRGDNQPKQSSLWDMKADKVLRVPKKRHVAQHHMAASKELQRLWAEQFPHDVAKPRESQVLVALGVDLKAFEDEPVIEYFQRGNLAFVASSVPLQGLDEIVGSEYLAAAYPVEVTA